MYFQNLSIGVIGFWLTVSIMSAILISLLTRIIYRYSFKKDLNFKRLIVIISSVLFLIFLIIIITNKPFLVRR